MAGTPPNGSAPAYSDAEGGLIDIHAIRSTPVAPAFVSQSAPSYPLDEKKPELSPPNPPSFYAAPKEKEKEPVKAIVPTAPARASGKQKKKVSRWIIFKLWFNTYRYDVLFLWTIHALI